MMEQALDLLSQCAAQLMRSGGMMNKDLAKEVTKFISTARAVPVKSETTALNGMPKTAYHDEGAAAQCGYCKRYTLDRKALRVSPYVCACGKSDGWSGSFQRPTDGDHWHGNWPDNSIQPVYPD
jgi:hypothetical protein